MGAFYKTFIRRSQRLLLLAWLAVLAGASAGAAVVNATFNSATDIAVSASSYTATGNTINFQLNFAPVTGTTLTVVNNTGLLFINGSFTNLPQGQSLTLPYNGTNYKFVANYFGGTGNDLVLLWANSKLMAWGDDTVGQLGNNDATISSLPVAVLQSGALIGKPVTAVASGDFHSVALCSDGTVYAWGSNASGQLGNTSTADSNVPVAVDTSGALSGRSVIAISTFGDHTLALCSDGAIVGWGYNGSGQLGIGFYSTRNLPAVVITTGTALQGKTVIAVRAGLRHSLALCSDGTIAAWGSNQYGQLGTGDKSARNKATAVKTTGTALSGKTVVKIAASTEYTIAVCSDGTVVGWGGNSFGQIGNGTTTATTSAVVVPTAGTALAGKTISSIAVGYYHTLALCSDGTMAAWGLASSGQLGSSVFQALVPTAVNRTGVLATRTVTSIATGYYNSMAVCSDGSLVVWGSNTSGQLGFSSSLFVGSTPSLIPSAGTALAGKNVIGAAGGYGHTLIVCSDGTVAACGNSTNGQIGNNGLTTVRSPINVVSTGALLGKRVTSAAAGVRFSVALCSDGSIASWGDTALGNGTTTGSLVPVLVNASGVLANKTPIAITAGGSHALALLSNGTVVAWGANSGALGNGIFTSATVPVAVSTAGVLAGKTVVAIAAGNSYYSLALCSDGKVMAWGQNGSGQLGNNSTTPSTVPVAVDDTGVLAGKIVTSIACGNSHSVAVCSDGTLATWGDNSAGQLGNNSKIQSLVPVLVDVSGVLAGKTVVKVFAASQRTTVLTSDGKVFGWGTWDLGNNQPSTGSQVPVAIDTSGILSGTSVLQVAASAYHTMVICGNGTLATWGNNDSGQLGLGTNVGQVSVPTAVPTTPLNADEHFIAAYGGPNSYHTLAVVATPLSASIISTLPATNVTPLSASISGEVNTQDNFAVVYFDYGTTTSYGTRVNANPSELSSSSLTGVSANLTGLQPGTVYHYRVGMTINGTAIYGDDILFITPSNNALLNELGISTGLTFPTFSSAVKTYSTYVLSSAPSFTVTPVPADSSATLQIKVGNGSLTSLATGSTSTNLAFSATGTTVIQVKVTATDTVTTQIYSITLSPRSSYGLWQITQFGFGTNKVAYNEDFDGDSVNNINEFAFGSDPKANEGSVRPLAYIGNVITPGSPSTEMIAGKLTAEFIRRSDFATQGITYTVQFSSKLTAWETDTRTPTVLATDGINQVVGLTFPKLSTGVQAKFFRVTVSVAP